MQPHRVRMTPVELAALLGLVAVLAAVLLPALSRYREAAHRSSCQNNLRQLGIVLIMYAGEHKSNKFPPLSPVPNNWMFDMAHVFPEYLTDLSVLICPSSPLARDDIFSLRRNDDHPGARIGDPHPDCVSSLFYIYTGYNIASDEQALALFDAYYERPGDLLSGRAQLDLTVPVWADSGRVPASSQADIPVMWDRLYVDERLCAHRPLGANVLHMDGHVAFIRYSHYNNSSYFPVTRLAAETFGSVVPRLSPDCYSF